MNLEERVKLLEEAIKDIVYILDSIAETDNDDSEGWADIQESIEELKEKLKKLNGT